MCVCPVCHRKEYVSSRKDQRLWIFFYYYYYFPSMWLCVIEIPQLIILGTYIVFIWWEIFGVKLDDRKIYIYEVRWQNQSKLSKVWCGMDRSRCLTSSSSISSTVLSEETEMRWCYYLSENCAGRQAAPSSFVFLHWIRPWYRTWQHYIKPDDRKNKCLLGETTADRIKLSQLCCTLLSK